MSSLKSKEMLLSSVVSGEMGKRGNKISFWNMNPPEAGTLWESSEPVELESVLNSINIEEELPQSYDLTLLYCIGWEFVWGKKPPELVTELRREILGKAGREEKLLDLEIEWLKLMAVDTDMF